MKKILSLILAISLCLSAVILLASCAGKSAYEIAVEGGFTGTEQEWLASLKGEPGEKGKDGEAGKDGAEGYPGLPGDAGLSPYDDLKYNQNYNKTVEDWLASLKGADANDGHNPAVSVDTEGYWVIDGTKQPVKVDGSKEAVVSVELVNTNFTVVKGDAALPQVEIKVKLESGAEWILPASHSVISTHSYDFTKEGVYPVTIKYGDKEVASEIVVEGLMVYFENFDSLGDNATMAEICAQAGFQIPVPHQNHANKVAVVQDGQTSTEKYPYADLYAQGIETWFLDGSDLTPYIVYGGLHRANFVELKIQSGRLVYNSHSNNGKMAGSTDSFLIIANNKEMNYAAQDTYTIQMDIQFSPMTDAGTTDVTDDDVYTTSIHPTSMGSTLALVAKFTDEGQKETSTAAGRPISVCAAFGNQYLMANVVRVSSWSLGTSALDAAGLEASADQSKNILTTLFPESTNDIWFGEEITVRFVITGRNAANPGYTVYMKKASDTEDKFVLVGEFDASKTTTKGFAAFMKEDSDGFAIQTRSLQKYSAFYIDNIAAWTGAGNMPTNTSTATYEDLNAAFNAANPAA